MALMDIKVPNIGDFKDVPIIEIMVKAGDEVKPDDPLLTLESDKAAMEVPAPAAGRIAEVLVGVGDKVSEGSAILRLETASKTKQDGASEGAAGRKPAPDKSPAQRAAVAEQAATPEQGGEESERPDPPGHKASRFPGLDAPPGNVHASPAVRRIARELDVDLTKVTGSGEKGRITKDDVKRQIARESGGGVGIPEIPPQDFAKFGPIEIAPMSRLKKLSGPHLHRSWLNVPHVTQADEADITDLEDYRKELDSDAKEKGYRVTLLAFLMKASVSALKAHPELNASLSPAKDALILKRYFNLGVAVDTPDGLVVPVIKDVDRKGILELSQELGAVSQRMREGRITPADIQGGTFSISSLGGIGGVMFTPIINAPEVAILGASRAVMKPVWDGSDFRPRLMLPVCVSYDHRAVDGALGARFLRKICDALTDVRQLVL
jgi:pyruvate dehydrogenase E2 component (dihydrolipoamide acetyltransferase)